jgi:hypothetical protein
MQKKIINLIFFYLVLFSFSSNAQVSQTVNNSNVNHYPNATEHSGIGYQRNGTFIIDSTYNYLGNTHGQDWFLHQRYLVESRDQWGNFLKATTFEYDTVNNVWFQHQKYEAEYHDSLTTSFWNAHVWDSKANRWRMSDSISFNDEGSPVINWYKAWDPVKFRFSRGQRIIYNYQSEILLSRDIQKFDTLSGNWKPDESISYTYNEDGVLSNELIMEWDSTSNDWKNYSIIQYVYNDDLLIQSETTQFWDDGNSWVNSFKYEYEYFEASKKLEKRLRSSWIPNVGWELGTQILYTYNENFLLQEALSQVWLEFENKWYNTAVYSYVYNPQGQRTEILYRSWDFAGHWVNESWTFYNFDDNGNQVQYVFKIWNNENNLWDNYYKSTNYWSEFVPSGIIKIPGLDIQVFPNPTGGIVYFSLNEDAKNLTATIYTIDGKLMLTEFIGANQAQINLANFPGGKYLLVVNSGGKKYVELVIKK